MTIETFRGTVTRVHFCNADGPWMSGKMDLENGGGPMGFAGKVAANVGDILEVTGAMDRHPKFGLQIKVESGLVRMDETPDALIHMLATHSDFEGLGPVRARAVVQAALELSQDGELSSALIAYPREIAERAGVREGIVQNAANVWAERKSYFDALSLLADQGWSNAQATRLVKAYGENAPAIIRGDPYMLIGKLSRFGFRTVDTVAQAMGISKSDPNRLQAGVAFCLDRIAEDGNTWTRREDLLQQSLEELQPDTLKAEDNVRDAIQNLINVGLITVSETPLEHEEIVSDSELARVEIEVFGRLVRGLRDDTHGELAISGPRADAVMPTLNDGQRAAMLGFALHRYNVIAGGAGVGKTYTMRAVCEIAEEQRLNVELCAPTGKAARKLSHATSREARTIHRLLEPRFDDETGRFVFLRNADNPIDADLVVVDEISMVDVRLMLKLLVALPSHCRLLLVGDNNQIPSVGPGAILRDLLSAQSRYPDSVHMLTDIVRQAGILARNTSAILNGLVVMEQDPAWGIHKTEKGHEKNTASLAASFVESIVMAPEPLEPFGRQLDLAWDIQVLAPMRKGPLGTYALNVELQQLRQRLLGNPAPDFTEENKAPKPMVGDRVIWTKNDYQLNLMNGTQAIVLEFPKGGAMRIITEDGTEVLVPGSKRLNVEVAYAMTIHKAQGSEWPLVMLCISSSHYIMRDRNLLYTGASRAAESLAILGDMGGIKGFAKEQKSGRRRTHGSFIVHAQGVAVRTD